MINKFNKQELEVIANWDIQYVKYKLIVEKMEKYTLGSVWIEQTWYPSYPEKKSITLHYTFKTPIKYKVIYISPEGIPWLKQLSAKNVPTGYPVIPFELDNMWEDCESITKEFIPDPEQFDAILLQEEFNPVAKQKEKTELFREISLHNKQVAIKTNSNWQAIFDFFKSLKPGDSFWTSPDKQYVLHTMTQDKKKQWVISAIDLNKKIKEFGICDFYYKRLYKAKPRSFAKETSTKI